MVHRMDKPDAHHDDLAVRGVGRPVRADFAYDRTLRLARDHPTMRVTLRLARLIIGGVFLFAIAFVEMLAELLAPIVLICGAAWAALPSVMSALGGTNPETSELVQTMLKSVPSHLAFGHVMLTPMGLIFDGLLLIAVVALCRTLQVVVSAGL
jgi:hypothetical protein